MLNNILISKETRKVLSKDNRFIGIEGENLQEVLVFNLDEEIEGNAVIELQFKDETKGFIEVDKTERGYELPVKSSLLTQEGIIKMQLRILQSGQEVFKSEIIRFDVYKAINATATIPDEYPTWIDNLESLKAELEQAEAERAEAFTQMQKDTETAINNIEDMTEAYNKNTQEKIDEYNANAQLVEPRIIELETQVSELETENEVLKNQIPVGEAEGENITLKDSAEMEFKELRIGGNSWQETRSGKNEFNKNDYQLLKAYISNNVITSESNNNIIYIPCLPSTTYAISKKAGMRFGVAYTEVLPEIGGSVEGWISNTTGTSITITTGENANYLVVYVRNGNIAGEITLEEVLDTLQIEKNSESTEYEEYGAMPSPEFRSEIRNVGENGSANITVCNVNLCKVNSKNVLVYSDAYNNFTIENNKIICSPSCLFGFKVKVKPNTTYTRTNIISEYTTGGNVAMRIREHSKEPKVYYEDENFVNQLNESFSKNGMYSKTFTTGDTTTWVIISLYCDCAITISDWGLYEGSVAPNNYIEHESQQITFPLSEGQRMYKDSYLADDGVHHKRGQVVLDGTEEWNGATDFYTSILASLISECPTSTEILGLSNAFLVNGYNYRKENNLYFHPNKNLMLRNPENKYYATLDEWKSYLAEQYANGTPVILEYELAEEIIEPYTEEQQLVYNEIKKSHSYKNVTHIFSTDETSPINHVIYRKDQETINKKQEERIAALESAIVS